MISAQDKSQRIDNYANTMFAYDSVHPAWIDKCAAYLISLFGADRLRGATVLDYAFGRGNWSLAFIKAGAARVVAYDASIGNVNRLTSYCATNEIYNIEICLGNVLTEPIDGIFDVIWVYGILQHIDQPLDFMNRLSTNLENDFGLMFVYAYSSDDLRNRLVTAARKGIVYESSSAFGDDSLLFNTYARLRARDDLAAPHIDWYSQKKLMSLLKESNLIPIQSCSAFQCFLGKSELPEFAPHHLICRRASPPPSNKLKRVEQKADLINFDDTVIGDLSDWLVDRIESQGRQFAIGLFNTHFSALRNHGYNKAIEDNFQFLLYVWIRNNCSMPDCPILATFINAGLNSAKGKSITWPKLVPPTSRLFKFISTINIRI